MSLSIFHKPVAPLLSSPLLALWLPHRSHGSRESRVGAGLYEGGTRIVESEVLTSEQESQRIAAAFGIACAITVYDGEDGQLYGEVEVSEGVSLQFCFDKAPGEVGACLYQVSLCRTTLALPWVVFELSLQGQWEFTVNEEIPLSVAQLAARGFYRLGLSNGDESSQLPPLSSHEKLELRLSMPREFWPQKWIDEEEGANY